MASNTLQNYEQVSGGGAGTAGLSMHRAKAVQIIGDAVATRTLTAKEAGATCLLDAAAVVYTLPAPVAGMVFDFVSTVTASAATVQTNAATVFIVGAIVGVTIATATPAGFAFNGTSHVGITMNGTTSGGIVGTTLRFKALSATVWQIEGVTIGSGTIVTPAV
jgi:hypothetical protein